MHPCVCRERTAWQGRTLGGSCGEGKEGTSGEHSGRLRGIWWAVRGSGLAGLTPAGEEGVGVGPACGGTDPCSSLTLQLGALMALALAPGGADAPAAVFLLGEAREGIAAALGEVGMRGSQSAQPHLAFLLGPFPPLSAHGPLFCTIPLGMGIGQP